MLKSFGYFDLIEAFGQPGCAICRLLQADEHRFLDSLLYEYVTDPDVQRSFRASRGLCSPHGWQLLKHRAGSTGIAILYEAALDEVINLMSAPNGTAQANFFARWLGGQSSDAGDLLAQILMPARGCVCCQALEDGERRYVEALTASIHEPPLRDAYRSSDGLCLPHFVRVCRQAAAPEQLEVFVTTQRAVWSKLKDELELFRAKTDPHRAHEPMAAEGTSWQRVIGALAGAQGVFGSQRGFTPRS